MTLQFVKHEEVSLKNDPLFNEVWLQDRIGEDPAILGLGELEVIDRERVQDKAGRLDLLLADTREDRRYEVEIMLGATDPNHIVRCIEYWDIERRRYPAYDHVAVLIAENITSRFINILSLFAGNIPLIAIQLSALKVNNQILLNFVRVLDQTSLRRDDDPDGGGGADYDRSYWEGRVNKDILQVVDRVLDMVNEKASPCQQLVYKKYHIGLTAGTSRNNFVFFIPKKSFVHIGAWVTDDKVWVQKLEEAGIRAGNNRSGVVRGIVTPKEFETHELLFRELVHQAVEEYQSA